MIYAYSRITTNHRNFTDTHQTIAADDYAMLAPAQPWGAFMGLFGIGTGEFVLVSAGEEHGHVEDGLKRVEELPDVANIDTLYLEPTVRPRSFARRTEPGLYVFRFFDVRNRDAEEIAELSRQAWNTFENTDDYQAIPQALFRQHYDGAAPERGRMLLCTWYDGLNSWQTSRAPAPEARQNFRKRHTLTGGAIAFATRLVE